MVWSQVKTVELAAKKSESLQDSWTEMMPKQTWKSLSMLQGCRDQRKEK